MATGSSLGVDAPTYQIANGNHSNHIEEEARQHCAPCKTNTLVTLTYTVESQVDEGVADLGTSHQDAVTTVIVDPDDSMMYSKVETPPTSAVGAGGVVEDSGDNPHYICQSCSRLTPLDSCYCTHCGHKRGRGRPKGVTGPKGLLPTKVPRTPASKQDLPDDHDHGKVTSSPSSSSSSPALDPRGAQTSTPSRQMHHKPVPIYHRSKPNMGKKSLLRGRSQANGPNTPQGGDPSQPPCGGALSSCVGLPTSATPPVQYMGAAPTAIVTIPISPEEGESPGRHNNTEGPVPPSTNTTPLHVDGQHCSAVNDKGEEPVMGGATSVGGAESKTGGGNQSNQSNWCSIASTPDQHTNQPVYIHHPSPLHSSQDPCSAIFPQGASAHSGEGTHAQWPQLSQGSPILLPRPLALSSDTASSRPSYQAPSLPSTTDNPDLVMFHVDMSIPGPHATPVVMAAGSQKDAQMIGGEHAKYFCHGKQPGEEAFSSPASRSTMFAPIFHVPMYSHAPLVTTQAPLVTSSHYQVLNPQNFMQTRCPPGTTSASLPHLQPIWTQPAPLGGAPRYGQGPCRQAAFQVMDSTPPPSGPARIQLLPLGLKQQAGSAGRNVAPPPNSMPSGWGQATWMLPSPHVSWPHPLNSPPAGTDHYGAGIKATPPALSGGGGGRGWYRHEYTPDGEMRSPTATNAHHVPSPAHRPTHSHLENGTGEHPVVISDVPTGKEGASVSCKPQEGM